MNIRSNNVVCHYKLKEILGKVPTDREKKKLSSKRSYNQFLQSWRMSRGAICPFIAHNRVFASRA